MALPKVIINTEMSAEARNKALKEFEQGLRSEEMSAVKRVVLYAFLNDALKNLVKAEPLNFIDLSRLSICQAVFTHADLPDLLFLQYVFNQITAVQDEPSYLKKTVLSMVQNYKRPLMLPLIRKMEKATFGFNLAAFFMRDPGWILLDVARFFSSNLTAEAKVEQLLNECLALSLARGMVPRFDDSFYEGLNAIAQLAERGGWMTAVGFFNRFLQPSRAVLLAEPSKQFQPQ